LIYIKITVDKMAHEKPYKFNSKDEKVIKIFSELGMPRNLAKTLMYISQVDECRSAEIERNARLRQPEVSVAMAELQKKGWIIKRELKKKGKGRPVHIYKLKSPLNKIIENFEHEKLREISEIKKDLNDLKTLLDDR
jgi:predicted transcriptional regulator